MASLLERTYNPDVLTCLANLSNDEVLTPPELANQVLDLLPDDLWRDPSVKILDPFCKSGVFLREAAKRFIRGLEDVFPDLQERVDHVMHEQLYGIAITEMTALLSRRSLYCSKFPNGRFSVSEFDGNEGNIRYRNIRHTWRNGKCVYCGASKEQYDRDEGLESHAYEFIHTSSPEEIFGMKFDVIVGNPPYQLDTGGSKRQAKPIYHLFVEQAKKLNPKYLTMIIQSRWFAGGMGLDTFRNSMMNDRHIVRIVDFANAKECFPQNSISGGVCYFLRDRERENDCLFTNVSNGDSNDMIRPLNEFPVLVRYNQAVPILRKVISHQDPSLSETVSAISPFGIPTSVRGTAVPSSSSDIRLLSSDGFSYISINTVKSKIDIFNSYKIAISQTGAEHACEPDKNGKFRVLTKSMCVLQPTDVCTHSYLAVGPMKDEDQCNNLLVYLKTKFIRFLILQAVSSIHISRQTFCFVPRLDFSHAWTDGELYARYGLEESEIEFIEGLIKPFDGAEQ
ncbi:Eco57I restriction-modification methylase domain-containing protein [Thermophilibacter mediterraneus]|uniref:Eco57I restriction-modification methylase domain-containing protein n=1 Tax=Thermophilibacter mediterraneus TaxID=1871031 RepID=UPI003208B49B